MSSGGTKSKKPTGLRLPSTLGQLFVVWWCLLNVTSVCQGLQCHADVGGSKVLSLCDYRCSVFYNGTHSNRGCVGFSDQQFCDAPMISCCSGDLCNDDGFNDAFVNNYRALLKKQKERIKKWEKAMTAIHVKSEAYSLMKSLIKDSKGLTEKHVLIKESSMTHTEKNLQELKENEMNQVKKQRETLTELEEEMSTIVDKSQQRYQSLEEDFADVKYDLDMEMPVSDAKLSHIESEIRNLKRLQEKQTYNYVYGNHASILKWSYIEWFVVSFLVVIAHAPNI